MASGSYGNDDPITNQDLLEGDEEYPTEKISWNFYAPNIVGNQSSLLAKLRIQLCKRYAIGTGDVFPNSNRANVLTVMVDDPPVYSAQQVLATIQKFDDDASFA